MKNTNTIVMVFMISMLSLVRFGVAAAGATVPEQITSIRSTGKLDGVKQLIGDVEGMYNTNTQYYCKYQEEIESVLELLSATNTDARAMLEMQMHSVLAKRTIATDTIKKSDMLHLLCLQEATVRRLVKLSGSHFDRKSVQLVASLLGDIRLSRVPDYKRAIVYENVPPPVPEGSHDSGPMSAGMNPDEIKNSIKKEQYKAAIASNEANYYQNLLQGDVLPRLNDFIASVLLRILSDTTERNRFSDDDLVRLGRVAHLTQSEMSRIGIQAQPNVKESAPSLDSNAPLKK